MKRKRYLLIAVVFALSIFLSGCSNSQKASQNKTINVGTNAEFAPFEYINDDGDVDGFDIALMKEIGKEENIDVKFTNMEFKSLAASLKTNSLDAVIAGMTITDERKESVDFTDSYYEATQSIIVKSDSNISSVSDLNGLKVAVQEGTTGDILVTPSDENKVITNKATEVKRFKKGSDAILELKNGGVDAVVIDSSPANKFVSMNAGKLKAIQDTSSQEQYGIAIAKGNTELANELNDGLEKAKKDGTYDKLVDKYINNDDQEQQVHSNNFFVNFLDDVKNVFITTNGYMLLLKGLVTTLYITAVATILGIVLGFIIALMKMTEIQKNKKTVLSRIANAYTSILRGTPVVVQLLIMYMVVFQSKYGIIVAMLTFGINSSAYVSESIRAGIMAVEKGQFEGGLSLGFSYGQSMRYVILPQAIKNSLPALGNEFIALLKETSIVGYVAIQDLTKAADFIISRTYNSFLPLIAIAIIYFVIVIILTKLLGILERRFRQGDNY